MSVTSIQKSDPSIANRYLADQLSEAERSIFEERLVADPTVLRELEATARFKLGLHGLSETGRLKQIVVDRTPRMPWLLSAAAAMVLAVTLGVLHWSRESPPKLAADPSSLADKNGNAPRIASAQAIFSPPKLAATLTSLADKNGNALKIAGTHAIFRRRGATYDAVIKLPASEQAIELRVLPDLDPPQPPPYRVSLVAAGGAQDKPFASLTGLQPADDGFVSVFVDSAKLTPGNYVLDISGDATSNRAGSEFAIRFNSSQ